jgi:hypothetical protein
MALELPRDPSVPLTRRLGMTLAAAWRGSVDIVATVVVEEPGQLVASTLGQRRR